MYSATRSGLDRSSPVVNRSVMRYRSLGTTGVKVSPLCLGAMMFGAMGNPDHDDCVRIIHRALDAGINFIDTADVYSAGESEEIVGKALEGRRDTVVLATKLHAPMGSDPNERGNSRRWIVREVEHSLRRLRTDRIDLYQVHRPEPGTDIDDTLSALSDLVHQGKVNYLGSSTFPAEAIVEAQWTAERRGHERFRVEQPPYSIFVRGIEADVLPTCEQYGMGVIPWSPLNGGFLTGRYRPGEPPPKTGRAARMPDRFDPERPGVQRKLALIPELEKIAADAGIPLTHLAIGFALAHPAVSAAIIGPRTMEQFEGLVDSAVSLDDDTLDHIDALVRPGTNLNRGESGWEHPALSQAWRRRRPVASR
jgi:aryl-alcohol dehydrogenase-like predicted oxidoreductase